MSIFNDSKLKLHKIIKNGVDNKPWDQIVVGLSGGKDSTAVTQLIIDVMIEYKHDISVLFLTSDTMIENPLITAQIKVVHDQINNISKKYNLNFDVQLLKPPCTDRYYYKTIALGYSTPLNSNGRWCTRLLKVKPLQQVYDSIEQSKKTTLLLTGVREDESSTRKRNIDNYFGEVDLVKDNDYLYSCAPIRNWKVSDVWMYLLDFTRDDDYLLDNSLLSKLYIDGADEKMCPSSVDMSLTENAEQCGKSRYGCYICPLVNVDRSLISNVKNGHDFQAYLELREWYIKRAFDAKYRDRMNRRGVTKLKRVRYFPVKNTVSFRRLKTLFNKSLDEFDIYEFKNETEALKFVDDNTIHSLKEAKKKTVLYSDNEILIKIDNAYYTIMTGRFSLAFRISFYKKIKQIEKKYDIIFIEEDEKKEIDKAIKEF